ncbi:class I SAM-dependent methyltransferase [soil metagenome]
MSRRFRHPIFARIYARISGAAEKKGAALHRAELLAGLYGRVIEIGAGNGLNFGHYPNTVDEVVAVEPEPYLRRLAEDAAGETSLAITVVDGAADSLGFADGSFDAAVCSLVLCSVTNQPGALAEVRRVLRPGGELRFYEHVIDPSPRFARFQRWVNLVHPHVAGGCHVTRDTEAAITNAGFDITSIRRFRFAPEWLSTAAAPKILGAATAPAR